MITFSKFLHNTYPKYHQTLFFGNYGIPIHIFQCSFWLHTVLRKLNHKAAGEFSFFDSQILYKLAFFGTESMQFFHFHEIFVFCFHSSHLLCHTYNTIIYLLTSLMADLCQNLNIVSLFGLNGTSFPRRNCPVKTEVVHSN